MFKIAIVCFGVLLAAPAWTQTLQAQQTQYFEYRCTIVDGVVVAPGGALVRNASTQEFVRRQSPMTFDTVTGRLQRAAAPAGIFETFSIIGHGNTISSLQAHDTDLGLGSVLHIRVDMPGPPYSFTLQMSGSTYSGTCQRTPI